MKLLKAILIVFVISSPVLAGQKEPVWFWFADCGGPKMKLEVRFDKKVIYQSSFPLCHAKRSSDYNQGHSKNLKFTFIPTRAIVWEGYRDEENTTEPNQKIECSIWLAGSEPDALILGVSCVADNIIFMNTTHIAHTTLRDASGITAGLEIITTPVKEDKQLEPKNK